MLKAIVLHALRGAFVADAASMGSHWYYNLDDLAKVVSNESPEFRSPPKPKYYSSETFPGHYLDGMLSPYGEQLMFVTEYVASKDTIDGSDMSIAMLEWAKNFGGRPDHALNTFMENMRKEDGSGKWPNCGADDNQAHIYMKAVPVTCKFAGKLNCREMVEEAIRVHQNNDEAAAFGLAASCVLEAVLLGSSVGEALDKCMQEATDPRVKDAFQQAEDAVANGISNEDLLGTVGRHCGLPGSFIGPIHLLRTLANSSSSDFYVDAVRTNILGCGDTCSRSVFVGAVIAAAHGGPPNDWMDKLDHDVENKLEALASSISEFSSPNSSPTIVGSLHLVSSLATAAVFYVIIHVFVVRDGNGRVLYMFPRRKTK